MQALLRRWSQLRARFWGRLGSAVTRGPEDSPLIGARRNGRVCVRVFTPPDAAGAYAAWRDANADAYGSTADWEVDTGHAADGRDFVVVWVPAHHASPDD